MPGVHRVVHASSGGHARRRLRLRVGRRFRRDKRRAVATAMGMVPRYLRQGCAGRSVRPSYNARMHSTVAILGAGAMGEALASGLLRAGWETGEISMAVRREERRRELAERTGCAVLLDPAEALVGKEVAVVAVKPRDVPHLLYQIQGSYQPGQVILSLAAG